MGLTVNAVLTTMPTMASVSPAEIRPSEIDCGRFERVAPSFVLVAIWSGARTSTGSVTTAPGTPTPWGRLP